jgi:hypothetical protein
VPRRSPTSADTPSAIPLVGRPTSVSKPP